MNIKQKITLRFTLIVATILLGSFGIAYENYSSFMKTTFYERLNDRTRNITTIAMDRERFDENTIHTLMLSIASNLRISIYDTTGNILIPIGEKIELRDQFKSFLLSQKGFEVQINDTQYVGFSDKNHHSYSIACAYDKTGYKKQEFLRNLFVIIWLMGVLTTAIVGWAFAKASLHPMTEVMKEVQNITARELELHQRLSLPTSKDEIAHLTRTFNSMLDRLESSFELQKDFVSNASHEFRTPLTVMKGQIQVALLKERTTIDYQKLLQSINDDINNLIGLLNALQELAKANADFPLKAFYPTPVLDTLVDAQNDLIRNKPGYNISITIGDLRDESMDYLYCNGDVNLLKSAFSNLMDNGCKFSPDHKMNVGIQFTQHNIRIQFSDEGVGISPEALPHIFEPFYRGNDTRNVYGHGIGLSLVKRIIEWHKGSITIDSETGKGSVFTITLPNLRNRKHQLITNEV